LANGFSRSASPRARRRDFAQRAPASSRTPDQLEADRVELLRVSKLRADAFEALSKLTRPEPINLSTRCEFRY
jgi:hypothetical protein